MTEKQYNKIIERLDRLECNIKDVKIFVSAHLNNEDLDWIISQYRTGGRAKQERELMEIVHKSEQHDRKT